jgi:hypothetical protein
VKSIDLTDFYNLGLTLSRFKNLPQESCSAQNFFFTTLGATQSLRRLLTGDSFDVGVAKGPGEEVIKYLGELDVKYCRNPDGSGKFPDNDVVVQSWEVSSLQRKLTAFENVLAAHTKQAATYYAAKIGIFETGDLVERAEQIFASDIRKKMPPEALEEYRAAGRALAFDMPTASAFHVARAIEIVLRLYRAHFVKAPVGRTMGAMIKSLEKHLGSGATPAPSEKTIRQLDQIRDLDRNRIMHPDDTFSRDASLIMFFNGISAITAMIGEM